MALSLPAGVRSLPDAKNPTLRSPLQAKPRCLNPSPELLDPPLRLSIVPSPARTPHLRPRLRLQTPSFASLGVSLSEGSDGESLEPGSLPPPSSGFLRRAGLVGAATMTSKILGLVREIVLAAVIGVGPVATAFNHAAVLPRFFASFLGGVNGPIHITVATTLSKIPKESRRQLIQKIHTIMFLIGGVVAALVYIFAEPIIFAFAPGLRVLAEGMLIGEMAKTQLKLMTPCILVAGSVGIGFGCLTAEGENILPSLSPSMTSIAIIASCIFYTLLKGSSTSSMNTALSGLFISSGASIGTLLQWIIQLVIYRKTEKKANVVSWKDFFKNKYVHKLFGLMLSATLNSGLMHIASLTDLYFSSFIPGAASGLSYAHLLVMAPLGILSSIIVLPMLPAFSRMAKQPSLWSDLKENLRRSILLCMVIILPVMCTVCVLAVPIIKIFFQRLIFDSAATNFVSSLLLCYMIGSPFWIIRELFAAVFYSLGDGNWPFLINVTVIILNSILDWFSVSVFGLGAQGLALSTGCVTALSVLALLFLLSNKLGGIIRIGEMGPLVLLLLGCCLISGFASMLSYKILHGLLSAILILRFCRLAEVLSVTLAGFLGVSVFFLPLAFVQSPLVTPVTDLLATLMKR